MKFQRSVGFCFLICCLPLSAQDLDKLLEKYYAARGGLEKLRTVSSLQMEGTLEVNATQMPIKIMARENQVRLEIQSGGVDIIKIFDGQDGWQINPMLGTIRPQKLRGKELAHLKDLADLTGPLVDPSKKGHRLTYLGTDHDGKQTVHRIKVLTATGRLRIYALDSESGLPLFLDETGEGKVIARYLETQAINGVLFPTKVQVGQPKTACHQAVHRKGDECSYFRRVEMRQILVNPDLDPNLFSPSEASLAASGN